MYSIQVVTAPASSLRAVDADLLKQHCRIEIDDDDDLIDAYQLAAITLVEQHTGVRVLRQTVRVLFDKFDRSQPMLLPVAPIDSIVEVEYADPDGAAQTVPTTDYTISLAGLVGRVSPLTEWPSTRIQLDAVRVECVVGWLTAAIPSGIKLAVMLLVGHWYINREAVGTVGDEVALAFGALLQPYRLNWPT